MLRLCVLGCFTLATAIALARDPVIGPAKVASKGLKGEVVPSPYRAYMVVDNRYPPKVAGSTNPDDRSPKDTTNKIHDLVCEHGLNPVVAIFVRKEAKDLPGVAKLAGEMNKLMTFPEYRGNKLASFVMFLNIEGMPKSVTVTNPDKTQTMVELDAEYPDDEKRDIPYATAIKDYASALKTPNVVFGLAPVTSKANTAWSLDPADDVTVVFFNRIRIVDRWKFAADGPSDEQIKTILATVEDSVLGTKKP